MRKFIFLCIALISMIAVNASQVNYQQSDQLHTYGTVVQAPVQDMPVYTADYTLATHYGTNVQINSAVVCVKEQITKSVPIIQGQINSFIYPEYGLNNNLNGFTEIGKNMILKHPTYCGNQINISGIPKYNQGGNTFTRHVLN